jgi:hypothetical protein
MPESLSMPEHCCFATLQTGQHGLSPMWPQRWELRTIENLKNSWSEGLRQLLSVSNGRHHLERSSLMEHLKHD